MKRYYIQHFSKTKIKVKEQHFYFCSKFHSHNRVFEDEYSPKLSVKQPLALYIYIYFLSISVHNEMEFLSHFLFDDIASGK